MGFAGGAPPANAAAFAAPPPEPLRRPQEAGVIGITTKAFQYICWFRAGLSEAGPESSVPSSIASRSLRWAESLFRRKQVNPLILSAR